VGEAASFVQRATHQNSDSEYMSDYQRMFLKGGTYFFTVVTYNRLPIFKSEEHIDLLKNCFKNTIASHPCLIDAIVIIPEHLHTIWTLPDNDSDFSTRWKLIKSTFSRQYSGAKKQHLSESMIKKNESGIWQRRFWEHAIRNKEDFFSYCDYIHYNPY
jgi:putative transposase